jgi:predicted dehydrogenase
MRKLLNEVSLALLDDPTIDAVYIPLPNGLHYEWTLKALAKGKHVLLEKPSVSNATEAELLFHHSLLSQPSAPVLLEAFHYRFQPAWQKFLSLLDRPNIASAYANAWVPGKLLFSRDDIRFRWELAGGAMNDLAGYPSTAVRDMFGTEPEECLSCVVDPCPKPRELCDQGFKAEFGFPNGGKGTIEGSLWASLWKTVAEAPKAVAKHREVKDEADQNGLPEGQEKFRTRTVTFRDYLFAAVWHSIDVENEFVVREKASGKEIKRWKEKQSTKAYTWHEMGVDQPGEPWWVSYRWQLEVFVDRVRGRPGSGVWLDGEDGINEMKMIAMAYDKSGLPQRPTSEFRL